MSFKMTNILGFLTTKELFTVFLFKTENQSVERVCVLGCHGCLKRLFINFLTKCHILLHKKLETQCK